MGVPVLNVLRSRRLRRKNAAKLVWLLVSPSLSETEPTPIKVGDTALALGLKRENARRAIRTLTFLRFLHCTKPPTKGTPGEYVLGSRALRMKDWHPPAGTLGGPPRPMEELPLWRDVA